MLTAAKRGLRSVFLCAMAMTLGILALVAGCGPTPVPAPAPPRFDGPPPPYDVTAYLDRCRQNLLAWNTAAAITYPGRMDLEVGDGRAFVAIIDISGKTWPEQIPNGTPAGAALSVQCRVTARLVAPADKSLDVSPADDGVRSLVPTGRAQWSWPVTANKSGHHELRLIIQPAVAVNGSVYDDPSEHSVTFVTGVDAHGTTWQDFTAWWSENWPSIVSVAAAFGAAILAVVKWSSSLVEALRAMRRRPPAEDPVRPTEDRSGYL